MDKKFFRRDQIWFVQKDEYGYSELVALSDFKIRNDASFEKDYLAGVKTAISHAKRRMEGFKEGKVKPSEYNPGTTVYILVEELKEYVEE